MDAKDFKYMTYLIATAVWTVVKFCGQHRGDFAEANEAYDLFMSLAKKQPVPFREEDD